MTRSHEVDKHGVLSHALQIPVCFVVKNRYASSSTVMGAIHARGARDNVTRISGLERSRNEMRTGQPKNRLGEPKRLKRTYEDQCDVLYQDLVTARKSNVNHHLSMWSPKKNDNYRIKVTKSSRRLG